MNKAELVVAISEAIKLSKKDTEKVLDSFFEEVAHALEKGEVVKISGFGAFQVKSRKERIGASPVTGEKIKIPATKTIGFKPSKGLKDIVK